MRNRRTLFVMLGLFVVLAAITLLQSQTISTPVSPTATPVSTGQRLFTGWDVSNVQAIRLLDPATQNVLTIRRADTGDGWDTFDAQKMLNQEVAKAIVETVAGFIYQRRFTPADSELAQYGLRQQDLTLLVQIVLKSGEGHVIAIGGLTQDGENAYALVDELNEIYLLQSRPVAFLIYYFDESQGQ